MKMKDISIYEPLFGAWYVVGYLGAGNFSKVYEIERKEYDQVYRSVLKVISIPQNENEVELLHNKGTDKELISSDYDDLVESIMEENARMFELRGHPNIVSYEDFTAIPHDNGIGCDVLIRMEKLTPLTDYLREWEMTEADVIKMGIDLCQALIAYHHKDIIQQEINPLNIFISDSGNYKLEDSGIVRAIEKNTTMLFGKGHCAHLAPEVYQGSPYGMQAEIYSLGIVMYRLLNYNRMPLSPLPPEPINFRMNEEAIERRMFGETLPAPAKASPRLGQIICKACAYRPTDRYNTAEEMQRDLEEISDKIVSTE